MYKINEVSDIIAKQYQEIGKPSDDDFVPVSMHPGHYIVSFQTYEEAEKYPSLFFINVYVQKTELSDYTL